MIIWKEKYTVKVKVNLIFFNINSKKYKKKIKIIINNKFKKQNKNSKKKII